MTAVSDFELECKLLKTSVKQHLDEKLKELPEEIQDLLKHCCVLSGGAIASLYHGEKPKDYDLWAKSSATIIGITKELARLKDFVTADKGEHYTYMTGASYVSPNAITLKNSIQFIILGDYKEQREKFDFIHCKPYYDLHTDRFHISELQWNAIKNKKLIVNSGRTPANSRINKFSLRGWNGSF